MAERRCYQVELKGGPYDGTPGLVWQDDGGHPPPESVLVGTCPGDGTCQAGLRAHCYRVSRGQPHVCYWTEDEAIKPVELVEYPRTKLEEPRTKEGDWTAVYALGPREPTPQALPDALYVPTEWVEERELVKAIVRIARGFGRAAMPRCRCALVPVEHVGVEEATRAAEAARRARLPEQRGAGRIPEEEGEGG